MFLAWLNRLLLLPILVSPKPTPPPEFLEAFLPFYGDLDILVKIGKKLIIINADLNICQTVL
tara:strand:+ start:236 stop:421 length:186 start_codon:yes stop_codon:yes gene_type:complete